MCGVVGVKPTYGRVSRWGLVAYASSLDQIGIFSHTVADSAALLEVIAGPDPLDATCATRPPENWSAAAVAPTPPGLVVGVPRQARAQANHPAVTDALSRCEEAIIAAGGRVVELDLTTTDLAIAAYYIVASAEASSNLARYDGVRYGYRTPLQPGDTLRQMYERTRDEGFGPEVKRRIMLGTYVLSAGYYDAFYLKAQQVRTLVRQDYARAFALVDLVAMPTTPTPAFRLGEKTDDPLQMYLADIFTVSANLAGLPALSVPCGFSEDRLPIGLQLTGRMFDEASVLRAGDAYQRDTAWHLETP